MRMMARTGVWVTDGRRENRWERKKIIAARRTQTDPGLIVC